MKRRPKAELIKLIKKGYSQSEIAKIFNVSQTAVGKWLKYYGIESKSKKILEDLSDQELLNWKILERASNGSYNKTRWKCQCKCGNIRIVTASDLKIGKHKSCGKCHSHELIQNSWWIELQRQAKRRNLEFSISKDYIYELWKKQDAKCAISGLEMYFPKKAREQCCGKCTASLDRIKNDKGYVEGNVQWVRKEINKMRREYSLNDYIKMCKIVTEYQESVSCKLS